MADFLVLDRAIAPGPSGPEVLKPGRIVTDDQYDIAQLKTQGVAVVAYNPGAMSAALTAFRASSSPASLVALLLADGAI